MITSENVDFNNLRLISEVEKSCFVLEIFNCFCSNHSINFECRDVMTSISTRGRVHFSDFIILIVNHLVMKLGQLLDIVMGSTLKKGLA